MNRIIRAAACATLSAVVSLSVAHAATIDIDMRSVGNAGNIADIRTGHGAVAYSYYIGTYEVTNAQYVKFLNSIDPNGENRYGVYSTEMSNPNSNPINKGGIDFDANAAAGLKYRAKAQHADKPVNFVDFYDAARFANWVAGGNTETGFYQLQSSQLSNGVWLTNIVGQGVHGTANGGNYVAIANEDEWYKAAYHKNDGVTANYFLFPTGSDILPTQASATLTGEIANPGANVVNFNGSANWDGTEQGNFTTVGSAGIGSASPYGTFDQGGNAWEWLDTAFSSSQNVIRGTSQWIVEEEPGQSAAGYFMQATHAASYQKILGGSSLGFRLTSLVPIAAVPVPGAAWMLLPALLSLSGNVRRHAVNARA